MADVSDWIFNPRWRCPCIKLTRMQVERDTFLFDQNPGIYLCLDDFIQRTLFSDTLLSHDPSDHVIFKMTYIYVYWTCYDYKISFISYSGLYVIIKELFKLLTGTIYEGNYI